MHRIAIVLIIFGGIDTALGGDGVGTPRTVLDTKRLYLIPLFSQRRRGGCPGKAGANHYGAIFSSVGGVDKFIGKTVIIPFFFKRAGRYTRIEFHIFKTLASFFG
jgi:hypothetical protein